MSYGSRKYSLNSFQTIQRLWIFVGKALESDSSWLKIYGKGILFNKGKTNPNDIDDKARTLYCATESINQVQRLTN
jgi:hypothetical protein